MKKALKPAGLLFVALLVAIQFFPGETTNPAVDPAATFEAVAKPSAELASVVNRACGDCHSHNTAWPWYSRVAPVSWLVASDVKEGRARLNFSEWGRYGPEMAKLRMAKACEEAKEGGMPLWYYLPLHPQARLSAGGVSAICSWSPAPGKRNEKAD